MDLFKEVDRNQIEVIPINYVHLIQLSKLSQHHGDPFDRLIISQAIAEELTVFTRDKAFKKYQVKLKWK